MNPVVYQTKIQNPGQVIIEDIRLISYTGFEFDLKPHFIYFEINESLMVNFLTGSILLTESLNLIRHLPVIGNEILRISFYTPSAEKVTQDFSIIGISRRIIDGTKSITYNLNFTSQEAVKSSSEKISKSYSNMSYSDIIKSIFDNHIKVSKNIIIEDIPNTKNIVFPFMIPSDCINLLTSKIIDAKGNSNYIFYETLDNFFIRPLINNSTNPSKTYRTFFNVNTAFTIKDYDRIRDIEIYECNNTLKQTLEGSFSSTLISVDLNKKKIDFSTFDYNQNFKNTEHSNQYGLIPAVNEPFSSKSKSVIKIAPKSSFLFDNIPDNEKYSDYILSRNSQLNLSDYFKIGISVQGDSRRRVGEVIDIKINTPEAVGKLNEKYDPYLSGLYSISKITHKVALDSYTLNMFLIKNSMTIPYPDFKKEDSQ